MILHRRFDPFSLFRFDPRHRATAPVLHLSISIGMASATGCTLCGLSTAGIDGRGSSSCNGDASVGLSMYDGRHPFQPHRQRRK